MRLTVRTLWSRFRASLDRQSDEVGVDEEIGTHLQMLQSRFEAQGLRPEEARRAARTAFGEVERLKDHLREQQSLLWVDQIRQDVRYALRTTGNTPTVSLAIVVTLALGIGANAAIFSLVNGVLLAPLQYSAPDRIVAVEPLWKNTGLTNPTSSAPDFHDWRAQNHVLEYLAYYSGGESRAVVDGAPGFAFIQIVTADFFGVFGVSPAAGRVWSERDGSAAVAVVSHEWATAHFGDALAAVGRRLTLIAQTSIEPGTLAPSVRETTARLNPGIPIRFSTMDETFRQALAYPRFRTVLVVSFALLAVALALVGIYGVLSSLVAERTSEIGLRLALGAVRGDIFRQVIGASMRLVCWGLLAGVGGALLAVRGLQSFLYGVSSHDPFTIVAVIAMLAGTAFVASSIPAVRAACLDPLIALRQE